MHKFRFSFLIFMVLILDLAAYSQSLSSSPYSRYGIGDIQESSSAQSVAMGGLEKALHSPYWINYNNPASYSGLELSTFQTGIKVSLTEQSTSNSSQKIRNGGMTSLAFGIPLKRFWGMSFGLVPYSSVGYKISTQGQLSNGEELSYIYNGSGGLNRVYLGTGINPFPNKPDSSLLKGFSLGINVSYLFGSLNYERRLLFANSANSSGYYNIHQVDLYELGDFYLDYGIQYKFKLKNKWSLSTGITASTATNISGTHSNLALTYLLVNGFESTKDTITTFEDKKGSLTLPTHFGLGIVAHYSDRLLVGFDYKTQDWSSYNSFGIQDSLNNSNSISFGMQFIPNPASGRGFWQHVQYRIGANYSNTYLKIRNNLLSQQSVTLGAGFPIIKSLSTLNLALQYGTRGTLENNLLKEKFYAVTVGLTFSDKWFIKRKFD